MSRIPPPRRHAPLRLPPEELVELVVVRGGSAEETFSGGGGDQGFVGEAVGPTRLGSAPTGSVPWPRIAKSWGRGASESVSGSVWNRIGGGIGSTSCFA